MKPVGITGNVDKPEVVRVARTLVAEMKRLRAPFLLDQTLAQRLDRANGAPLHELGDGCRLLIVLGGDGTVLRTAREIHPREVPILAVNLGKLGFLAAVAPSALKRVLPSVLRGHPAISEHATLGVTVRGKGRRLQRLVALNDAVITRGNVSRVMEMELRVDGEHLNSYLCDGMIFSTPTGSTAYSLSAGGPIIAPGARVFAITPICPHTLSNRSMIVGEHSSVEARILGRADEPFLAMDGQSSIRLNADDLVSVKMGRYKVKMITATGASFFTLLRKKLRWVGSNI